MIEDFNLILKKGAFVSLIGHSGCGKPTVLTMTAGLNAISDGAITLDGTHIEGADPERAVVFQSPNPFLWQAAKQNVCDGCASGVSGKRHPPACWHRTGLCAFAKAAAAGRTVWHAGQPDPLGVARSADGGVEPHQRNRSLRVHDVDEAILLADRLVMTTNGPNATIGKITDVNLPRPRNRRGLLDHPDYYVYRAEVLGFLREYENGHKKKDVA